MTLRRPRIVFEMIGKTATIVAQITIAGSGLLTQMMISGAIATIGVTCRMIAYGNRLTSSSRLCTNRNAASTPSTTDSANARKVIFRVTISAEVSRVQSCTSVSKMSVGIGTR